MFLHEGYHSSPNLYGYLIRCDFIWLFYEDKGPEFRVVVINPEFVFFTVEFNIGMKSRDWDIWDPCLALMASSLLLKNKNFGKLWKVPALLCHFPWTPIYTCFFRRSWWLLKLIQEWYRVHQVGPVLQGPRFLSRSSSFWVGLSCRPRIRVFSRRPSWLSWTAASWFSSLTSVSSIGNVHILRFQNNHKDW